MSLFSHRNPLRERKKWMWCVMLEHILPKNNYRAELKPYLIINPIWTGTIWGTRETFWIFYFICRIDSSIDVARTGYRFTPVFFSIPTTAFGLRRCNGGGDILFQTLQSNCQRYSNDIIPGDNYVRNKSFLLYNFLL